MSSKTFFSIEFDFHASPQLLYQYLSTPSGLSEWFADNVNSRGENFEFIVEFESCEGAVGETMSFRIQPDGGGLTLIELEVSSTTKGTSLL